MFCHQLWYAECEKMSLLEKEGHSYSDCWDIESGGMIF
jgi:hypothetical protein